MKLSIKLKSQVAEAPVAAKPKPKPKVSLKNTPSKFKKPGQKKATPEVTDSLYKFYSSLYKQNPKSEMAAKWLIEHGCLDDDEVVSLQMASMSL